MFIAWPGYGCGSVEHPRLRGKGRGRGGGGGGGLQYTEQLLALLFL